MTTRPKPPGRKRAGDSVVLFRYAHRLGPAWFLVRWRGGSWWRFDVQQAHIQGFGPGYTPCLLMPDGGLCSGLWVTQWNVGPLTIERRVDP